MNFVRVAGNGIIALPQASPHQSFKSRVGYRYL
jgi:hypothetical protein